MRSCGFSHRRILMWGLKELKLKRGMTQQQLGESAGLSRSRITDFESGQRFAGGMSLDVAMRICDVLHAKNPRKLLELDTAE